jgi:hypothetical protein
VIFDGYVPAVIPNTELMLLVIVIRGVYPVVGSPPAELQNPEVAYDHPDGRVVFVVLKST